MAWRKPLTPPFYLRSERMDREVNEGCVRLSGQGHVCFVISDLVMLCHLVQKAFFDIMSYYCKLKGGTNRSNTIFKKNNRFRLARSVVGFDEGSEEQHTFWR